MSPATLLRIAFLSSAFAVSAWWAFGIVSGIAALVGALAGGILQIRGFFDGGRHGLRRGIAVASLVALVMCSPWLGALFSASIAILVPNACVALAISFFCAVALQILSGRFTALRIFESVILGLLFCLPLLASNGGQFTRPQWLADCVIERGLSLPLILALLGMTIAVASLALQPGANEPASGPPKSRHRQLSVLLLVLILGAFVAWDAFLLFGPVKTSPAPILPPVSFAGDPPPPLPPQPNTLVAIQFTITHTPAKRLGGFYFRINDQAELSLEASPVGAPVETKIYYLDKSIGNLSLAGHSKFASLPPPGHSFKKADLVHTKVPLVSEKSEIDEKKVSPICELDLIAQEPESAPQQVSALMERISSSVNGTTKAASGSFMEQIQTSIRSKPERAQSLLLQAMAITDWLEQNGDFSGGNKTQEALSVEEFVKGGLKGNSGDFARLATAMLKSQGIKARLAEGFFHPMEAIPIDQLLLTDSHRETWVEVLTAKGDWIILPIRPTKVSDRDPPPPQEDLKQQLFDEIEKGPASQTTASYAGPVHHTRPSILIPLAILVLAVASVWWVLTFFCIPIWEICGRPTLVVRGLSQKSPHTERNSLLLTRFFEVSWPNSFPSRRQMLGEASRRAVAVFRPRHFGESWEAYAISMASTMPSLSKRFKKILDLQQAGIIGCASSAWEYSTFALAVSFSLERFQIRKKQNPTPKAQP